MPIAMPTSHLSLNNIFLFVVLPIVAISLQQSKQYCAAPMHCGCDSIILVVAKSSYLIFKFIQENTFICHMVCCNFVCFVTVVFA